MANFLLAMGVTDLVSSVGLPGSADLGKHIFRSLYPQFQSLSHIYKENAAVQLQI